MEEKAVRKRKERE
jgi:hypothetical protein